MPSPTTYRILPQGWIHRKLRQKVSPVVIAAVVQVVVPALQNERKKQKKKFVNSSYIQPTNQRTNPHKDHQPFLQYTYVRFAVSIFRYLVLRIIIFFLIFCLRNISPFLLFLSYSPTRCFLATCLVSGTSCWGWVYNIPGIYYSYIYIYI